MVEGRETQGGLINLSWSADHGSDPEKLVHLPVHLVPVDDSDGYGGGGKHR